MNDISLDITDQDGVAMQLARALPTLKTVTFGSDVKDVADYRGPEPPPELGVLARVARRLSRR